MHVIRPDHFDQQRSTTLLRALRPVTGKIAISTHEGLRLVAFQDIAYCEADSNYTRITLRDKTCLMVCKTLAKVGAFLPLSQFIRVHQSYIIQFGLIRMIRREDVVLEDGKVIPVSRVSRKKLLAYVSSNTLKI